MIEDWRVTLERLGSDNRSGASELLSGAVAVLRAARQRGREATVDAARGVTAAQPSMAPFWNAAVSALADLECPGALDRFARRVERAAPAMARFAVQVLACEPDGGARGLRVTTCSHSHSVVACLEAIARVRRLTVACAEGRPAMEGRRLAARVAALGAQVEFYTDAGVSVALERTDALVVGADAVGADWFLNKCGTGPLAAACVARGVPVFVVASLDKFLAPSLAARLRIEEKPAADVWDEAPPGVAVRNVYFEKVPADLVTAVITDVGVLGVDMVAQACRAQASALGPAIESLLTAADR